VSIQNDNKIATLLYKITDDAPLNNARWLVTVGEGNDARDQEFFEKSFHRLIRRKENPSRENKRTFQDFVHGTEKEK